MSAPRSPLTAHSELRAHHHKVARRGRLGLAYHYAVLFLLEALA